MVLTREFFDGWMCSNINPILDHYGLVGSDMSEVYNILYEENPLYLLWGVLWSLRSYKDRVIACDIIASQCYSDNMEFRLIKEYINTVAEKAGDEDASSDCIKRYADSLFIATIDLVLSGNKSYYGLHDKLLYRMIKFLVDDNFETLQSIASVVALFVINDGNDRVDINRKHYICEIIKKFSYVRSILFGKDE
jgi:hypothetical protein